MTLPCTHTLLASKLLLWSEELIVDTPENLLKTFAQTVEQQDFPSDVAVRVAVAREGKAEIRIDSNGRKIIFAVKTDLHPSRRLLGAEAALSDKLLLSPHIPAPLAEDYRQAGINHADLNGRLFIKAPGLLLDREPKSRKFTNPASEQDLFAPKTSRIVRALLSRRDHAWRQQELAERTEVSPGLVSRTLNALIDERYVSSEKVEGERRAREYRLKDFDSLLDAWRAADDWDSRVTIRQYSLLVGSVNEIARTVRDALGESVTFTQWFAASLRRPYTTSPLVSGYIVSKNRPVDIHLGRQVERGGNLWLIEPQDEGVILESQTVEGFRLVSDVQIYLDLLQVGQRGPDQADELRRWEGFGR